MTSAVSVPNERIPEQAERLLSHPVRRAALALAFSESMASSAEVLVAGNSFYPRMLDDIKAASSSVHLNQFGFRPGVIGDSFADALIAKAAEGVPVRLVVDSQGSQCRAVPVRSPNETKRPLAGCFEPSTAHRTKPAARST